MGLFFFAIAPNIGAAQIRNKPDLTVIKIFTTKKCKLAVTLKNIGTGQFSYLFYSEDDHKGVGVHVTIDGKQWGEKKLWQFDRVRRLRRPGGTATCVFDYTVESPVEVKAAVDIYNTLIEVNVDNNRMTQIVSCGPRPGTIPAKPAQPTVDRRKVKPPSKPAAPVVSAPVAKKAPQQLALDLKDIHLAYKKSFDSLQILTGSDVISHGSDWEKCRLKPHLYHIRQENWNNFFWEIDTAKKEVYKVNSGEFCRASGDKRKIPAAVEESGDFIYIRFPIVSLVYVPADKSIQVKTAGSVLSDGRNWESCNLSNSVYHLKEEFWSFSYWKVDTLEKKAWRIKGKPFCKPGGKGESLEASVRVSD
jgi:hypothetical protein